MGAAPPIPYLAAAYASTSASTSVIVPVTAVGGVAGGDCIVVAISMAPGVTCTAATDDAGNTYTVYSALPGTGTTYALANPSQTGGLAQGQSVYLTLSGSSQVGVEILGIPNVLGFEFDGGTNDLSPNGAMTAALIGSGGTPVARTVSVGLLSASADAMSSIATASGAPVVSAILPGSQLSVPGVGIAQIAYMVTDATGSQTATVTLAGTTNFVMSNFGFQIGLPYIQNDSLAAGVLTRAYSQTLNVIGCGSPVATLSSGSLPPGLTLVTAGGQTTISGTPTTAGSYSFVLEAADTVGANTTTLFPFTIEVVPFALTGVPAVAPSYPQNELSPVDCDFEGTGWTWAAGSNASGVSKVTGYAATGSSSLLWTVTADGDSYLQTGFYPAAPGPYRASSLMVPRGPVGSTCVAMAFYNGTTLLSFQLGVRQGQPGNGNGWLPCNGLFRAPPTTTQCRMIAYAFGAYAGDVIALDTNFFSADSSQILVDWVNTAFTDGSVAGQMFMDISPWVIMDDDGSQGITLTRGRQNRITENQAGSANWGLRNDSGYFTKFSSQALAAAVGGTCDIGKRYQINFADENGVWYTRADGPLSGSSYTTEDTGNTADANVSGTDVLAALSRQDQMTCWTRQQIFYDANQYGLAYHWSLDDAGNVGGAGVGAETSGNRGPALKLRNTDSTNTATIAWQSTTGGIETLADSVGAGQPDGSEYWAAESPQIPGELVRGLDANVLGPFTSPLGSVYFVPHQVTMGNQNYFGGETGFYLQAQLPASPIALSNPGDVEFWFTQDPLIKTSAAGAAPVGPYIPLSLAEGKSGRVIAIGMYLNAGVVEFEMAFYAKPPGTGPLNFAGVAPPNPTQSVSTPIHADAQQVPHHCVVQFLNNGAGMIVQLWLDGSIVGTIPWPASFAYDTVTVGGCFGGGGAHAGAVQLVSAWNSNLSESVIRQHCALGQYGMFEQATDGAVSALAQFSDIPAFWNGIPRNVSLGLTLTDYLDLSGSNGLTNMQLYEQAEQGLIYVDALGHLKFSTRDARMGYHGPDLYLPPDTFGSDMGYQLNDQYLVNEAAVTTAIFAAQAEEATGFVGLVNNQYVATTSGAFVNNESQQQYGTYATNPVASPIQLPLFSWSRAGTQLGLPSFDFSTTPYLDDWAAWAANASSTTWMVPGTLEVDLLTLDTSTGLGISSFYALDIGNMVAPSGTLPVSFPTQQLSMEWFIEGINETKTLKSHTIQFYVSPAEQQRAWIPGDPTYGVLGQTAQVGVSQYDTHAIAALYKDVSHDAGGPYWPPQFSQQMNSPTLSTLLANPAVAGAGFLENVQSLNGNGDFAGALGTGWGGYDGTFSVDTTPPTGCSTDNCGQFVVNTGLGATGNVSTILNSGQSFTPQTGRYYWVTARVYVAAAPGNNFRLGLNLGNGSGYLAAAVQTISGVPVNQWTSVGALVFVAEGAGYTTAGPVLSYLDPASLNVNTISYTEVRVQMVTGGFVGANDIRGLVEPLQLMVTPPMLSVRTLGNAQTVSAGALSNPVVAWDTADADNTGGLGLIPGYPSWYCVTVPGFYDLDHSCVWHATSAAAHALQSFFLVARGAAQSLAAGTGAPLTAAAYVSPCGSIQPTNATAANSCNPVTTGSHRLYLGFGDMVALAAQADTAQSLFGTGATTSMSLIFRGQSVLQDGVQFNSLINGGTVTDNPLTSSFTTTYPCTMTQTYTGNFKSGAVNPGARRYSNGMVIQGYNPADKKFGSQISLITFNATQMISDLSATGTSLKAAWLTFTTPPEWVPPSKAKSLLPTGVVGGGGSGGPVGTPPPPVIEPPPPARQGPKQGVLMLGYTMPPAGSGPLFLVQEQAPTPRVDKHRVTWRTTDKPQHHRIKLPDSFITAFQNGTATMLTVGDQFSTGDQFYLQVNGGAGSWVIELEFTVTP